MSRGFVKEGDQEEVPMVLPRAFLPKNVPNYVTEEGLKLLQEEMLTLKQERASAGSNYVLKNYIDAKINLLSERLNSAVLLDVKNRKGDADVVSFGSYVKFNDKVVRIVGVDEADASKGLISFVSPIAKALIGRKKGDRVEVKLPRGVETVEIQGVFESYELRAMSREHEVRKTNLPPKEVENLAVGNQLSAVSGQSSEFIVQSSELPSTGSGTTDTVTELVEVTESSEFNVQSSEFKPENNPTDFLPIVNDRGNIVGRALYCEIHNGNKVLHPAVHLIVFNSKNETVAKYCWHVAFGETPEKTLKRRIPEVTSESVKPKFKKSYISEREKEKELVSVFTVVSDADFLPSPDDKEYAKIFAKS